MVLIAVPKHPERQKSRTWSTFEKSCVWIFQYINPRDTFGAWLAQKRVRSSFRLPGADFGSEIDHRCQHWLGNHHTKLGNRPGMNFGRVWVISGPNPVLLRASLSLAVAIHRNIHQTHVDIGVQINQSVHLNSRRFFNGNIFHALL